MNDTASRVAAISALPKGTKLPDLNEMVGFAEWRSNPVTVELLARIDAKVVEFMNHNKTLAPCRGCGAERSDSQKVDRAWNSGVIDGLNVVGHAMLNRPLDLAPEDALPMAEPS